VLRSFRCAEAERLRQRFPIRRFRAIERGLRTALAAPGWKSPGIRAQDFPRVDGRESLSEGTGEGSTASALTTRGESAIAGRDGNVSRTTSAIRVTGVGTPLQNQRQVWLNLQTAYDPEVAAEKLSRVIEREVQPSPMAATSPWSWQPFSRWSHARIIGFRVPLEPWLPD